MNFQTEPGRIFAANEQGTVLAEVILEPKGDSTVRLTHTFVDDSLRGQGVAGKLMSAAVDYCKNGNLRLIPECSYAVSWFEKHPEYDGLLER